MDKKKIWWYFFLIFPYIKPSIISDLQILSMLENIYDIWRLISVILVFYSFLLRKKINPFILSIFAYFGYIFFITLVRQGNYWNMIVQEGSMLAVCLLVFICSDKNELKYLLYAFKELLAFFLFINAITVFIYEPRGGMYVSDIYLDSIKVNNYFLGYDNKHINYILPYFGVSIIYDRLYYGYIRNKTIILHIIINLAVIMCASVTTWAAIVIFYFCLLFMEKKYFKKLINSYIILIGNFVVFYFLIILRIYNKLSIYIIKIFHKDLVFAREYIWKLYLNAVSKHFVLGYGYLSSTGRVAHAGVVHAHNMYLDILFEVGIVGIILYIIIIFLATNAGKSIICIDQKIAIIAIIAYMLAFQAEAFRYCPTFFILLTFAYELGNKFSYHTND